MEEIIISEFIKYSKYLETQNSNENNNSFRLRSVVSTIKVLKKNTNLLDNLDELIKVPGIGKGTIDKIKEIKDKGYLESVRDFIPEKDPTEEIKKVIGIGKIKANKLFKEHNIKSLEELVKAEKDGKIKLTDANKIGIKYYKELQERIPRDEVTKLFEIVKNKCLEMDGNIIVDICGSYRRKNLNCGDIDILITHKDIEKNDKVLKKIVNELHKIKFLVDDLNKIVTTKYNGICRLDEKSIARRIDIRYVNKECFPFALLYFTGSDNFNKNMRKIAKQKGLTLNEYQLIENNSKKNRKNILYRKRYF